MNSPIRWFGGKGPLAKKIIELFPPHHTYVEVFGGGGSVLFAKPPSKIEVYNDLDEGLTNFFLILRDRFDEFHRAVSLTPYSRREWQLCRDTWKDCEDIERARRWYVVARQSFSGDFGCSWSLSVTQSRRGMSGANAKWLSSIDHLPRISQRLLRVQVECYDWRKILEIYDTPDTLFYLDPPYVHSTRRGGEYTHEMTDDSHKELVQCLLELNGKVVLSGYENEIYAPLDIWTKHKFEVFCSAVGKTRGTGLQGKGSLVNQRRTEIVWVKPYTDGRLF